jgi:transposase-like protein
MGTSGSTAVVNQSSRKAPLPVKRQHCSQELKRQIVEESFAPGASVARAHGVNANRVFTWRRLYREGRLGTGSGPMPGLLAVRVAEATCPPDLTSGTGAQACSKDTEARGTV